MTHDQILVILNRIKFKDRSWILKPKGDGFLFQLSYYEPDVETGKTEEQRSRKWYISSHATETEIVETVFKACRVSNDHVLKEHFTYKNERVYSPHFDINARLHIASLGLFDKRPDNRKK